MKRILPLLSLLICLTLSSSCAAKRILRIESDPLGASVLFNGDAVGTTPLDFEYQYYGGVRISLQLDGFHTHSQQLELNPRWYSRFPMDILTEVLIPIGWVDKRLYRVVLEPGKDRLDSILRQSVLERAQALRTAGPEGPRSLPERVPVQPASIPAGEDDGER